MNLTIKIGRLTSDPELRYTNSGKAVASFNIAVRKKFKQEGQKDADFFKCVVWNKSAEYLSNNMKKGGRLAVVGRSENKNYENQQGQKVNYDEITVEDFEIIDYANDNNQNNYQQQNNQSFHQDSMPGMDKRGFNNDSDPFGNSSHIDISSKDLPF